MNRTAVLARFALIAILSAGCGSTVKGTTDDATITTRVKTMFVADPEIANARIEVKTFKGVVTLSGRVNSKQEADKAIALARKVRGVTEVKSALQVQ